MPDIVEFPDRRRVECLEHVRVLILVDHQVEVAVTATCSRSSQESTPESMVDYRAWDGYATADDMLSALNKRSVQ